MLLIRFLSTNKTWWICTTVINRICVHKTYSVHVLKQKKLLEIKACFWITFHWERLDSLRSISGKSFGNELLSIFWVRCEGSKTDGSLGLVETALKGLHLWFPLNQCVTTNMYTVQNTSCWKSKLPSSWSESSLLGDLQLTSNRYSIRSPLQRSSSHDLTWDEAFERAYRRTLAISDYNSIILFQ